MDEGKKIDENEGDVEKRKQSSDELETKMEFISSFVLRVLRIKSEKWQKLIQSEERLTLNKFVDISNIPLLTFALGHGGLLQVALGFPQSPKSKIVYFIRQVFEVITAENCRKILISGEVSDQMISELTIFSEEIITPLLCNPKNHTGWPEIIVDDVKKHVSNFKNTLYQIRGELYNEIVLPMPNGAEKIDQAVEVLENSCGQKLDMYLKSNIEGIIIQWAFQVNNILKEKMASSINNKVFPSPMDNVDYWITRLKNLEGIYSQLRHPRVKKMARYLEMSHSVYLDSFKTILTKLIAGVVETRDIVLHQIPLKKYFESAESVELTECKPSIRPMMHCITLLWINSRYYRKNERIVDLFRNVCNLIIQKSVSSFNQQNIFTGEASEQVQKIDSVLQIIEYFMEIYEINRKKIGTHFPMGTMPIYWTFDNTHIFFRLNEFTNRLKMVKIILQTTVEMFKLEKVEFAGIRGRSHSLKTLHIYEQYVKLYNNICDIEYDPLNTEDDSFKADYKRFTFKVLDIDRSLAKLFSEAFDECSNLEHTFKLLHIIGDLGKRPRILKELQPRLENLTNLIDNELLQVNKLFDDGIKAYENGIEPIIDLNFPPVAGILWWIHELRQRATIPMMEYKQIELLNSYHERYIKTQEKYNILSDNLDRIENTYYGRWVFNVPIICEKYLNTPLLIKDGRLIKLNFSYELVILLREIRYINFLDKYAIPDEGKILFERNELLQSAIRKLNLAILWYNKLQSGHATEMSLIESELIQIDDLLQKGINDLNWNTEVNEYIDDVFTRLEMLENRVLTAQNNLKRVFNLAIEINNFGMYEGYQSKKGGTTTYKNTRYNKIESFNSEMSKVLDHNYRLYFNTNDTVKTTDFDPEKWNNYIKYIDNQVRTAIINIVTTSLKVLLANMNTEKISIVTFMEVEANLQQPNINFQPSLETSYNGLKSMISQMIDDIINQSKIFNNISKEDDAKNYLFEVEHNQEILKMKNNITSIVDNTIDDIYKYVRIYENYSYIWIDDRYDYLDLFLKYGKVVTKKTLEQVESEEMDDEILLKRPALETFKDQIDVFENLYVESDLLPETHLFNGWLKLNMRGLKQGLLNFIRKWSNVFKQDLMNYVLNRLSDLDDFIEITTNNLSIELVSYDGLIRVMDSIIKVRERKEWGTEDMFDPLRDQIELLKTYGVEFPEETFDQNGKKKHSVYTLLEVLPEKWKNLIKLSNIVKHNVGPLQVNQSHLISKQITLFNTKMQQYRNEFKYKVLFSLDCDDVYGLIDQTHLELIHYEEAIVSLNKSCELFDVILPDSRLIEMCRKELTMAKELWDYYFLILNTIEDWKKTPWKNIDAEGMDMECKRFSKDLKALDKDIRQWEPYISIENIIKNLLTSLRAVTELQNPGIRERHWIELMQATDRAKDETEAKELVAIQMNDGTTLASLLSLNLHKYEDEVKNIVDKSIKEGAMEKILRELNTMWNNMEFEYEEHERTNIKIPKANEDLIETLEDNQTQVQNMMASKFVGHFEQEVTEWQRKLSNADQCISVWFEVQRKWMYLESIFVESDDIRSQLPEDSKRFDTIDIEFKA